MRLRNYKWSFFLLMVLPLSACYTFKKNEAQKTIAKPNLLFIFPDQLRNAAIGINQQDVVYTPNLDQLANEGLVISNAISNYPLCSPYRGMLMTGKLPFRNSVLSNANSKTYRYNNSWQKQDVTISDVLVKNGYDAGYVGKLHLTSPPPIPNKDTVLWDAYTPKEERHGFNFWYAYGTFDQHNKPHYWINDAKEDELSYVNEWSPKHEADVIIDYIKNPSSKTRNKDKPFALFWSLNPPHPPYQFVPDKYVERYKNKTLDEMLNRPNVDLKTNAEELAFHPGATRNLTSLAKEHVRDYYGMVTGVDEQIGRVLKVLKEEGLDKNTIVIITSDHGEMMGSHGLMSKNIWYEEAINIPFIIKWPEMIAPGQRKDILLSVTDIMPSLLNMMGIKDGIPADLDGRDLSSVILNGKGKEPASALYYFIEAGHPGSGYRGIRTHSHTYVITLDDQSIRRDFLFDNIKDPYQLNNLADRDMALKQRLENQLFTRLKQTKDPWLNNFNVKTEKKTLK